MSVAENKAALERAIAAFNDPERRSTYFDLYRDDVILHGFPPGLPPGIAGVRAFYAAVWAAFPDCHLIVENILGEGDLIAGSFALHASHRGEFMGVPPTGKPVVLQGITIARMVNGKCVERWNCADLLGLLQQLGAIPTPGQ